jgi:hypothetical protein
MKYPTTPQACIYDFLLPLTHCFCDISQGAYQWKGHTVAFDKVLKYKTIHNDILWCSSSSQELQQYLLILTCSLLI